MTLNFPTAPINNFASKFSGKRYKFDGTKWSGQATLSSPIVSEYADLIEQTSAAVLIEPSKYNYFKINVDADVEITIPNASPYSNFVMELNLNANQNIVTWASNIKWAGGIAPSNVNVVSLAIEFVSYDGVNWVGSILFIRYRASITSILASSFNPNEGETQTITITTANGADGTSIPYTITGIGIGDLSSGSLSGSFVINNNTASISLTYTNDFVTEGAETATLALDYYDDFIQWGISDTSIEPIGQQLFETPGTYTWIAPAYVTNVSLVCIGGGGGGVGHSYASDRGGSGGGGGGLVYVNNLNVIPFDTYTIIVGYGGSRLNTTSNTLGTKAQSGSGSVIYNSSGLSVALASGGSGGTVSQRNRNTSNGSVYLYKSGDGGAGGSATFYSANVNPTATGVIRTGGSSIAGSAVAKSSPTTGTTYFGSTGGGAATYNGVVLNGDIAQDLPARGDGTSPYGQGISSLIGSGGGGDSYGTAAVGAQSDGIWGAVRIVWGAGRSYPSTNVSTDL
jgi:hypothetical protein